MAIKRSSEKLKLTGDLQTDLKTLLGNKFRRRKFRPWVWVRQDCGLLEIFLEDCSYYCEWIKGEGGDIGIFRAHDNDRVVGANLPLRNFKGQVVMTGSGKKEHVLREKIKRAADAARKRVSGYSKEKRAELLKRARGAISEIPPWRKPPIEMPIQALREFIARFGHDVAVLVTWTHETGKYQFTTIGSDQLYANSAVNLRDILAKNVDALPLDKGKDQRGDHPNLRLDQKEIDFLLWILGRMYAEKDRLSSGHARYIRKHHDALLELLGKAKDVLTNQPK